MNLYQIWLKPREKPEEILQPDKPLEFTKNDTHSFSEWLKLTKAKPIERDEDILTRKDEFKKMTKARKFELIDKFIQERLKIIPPNIEKYNQKEEPKKPFSNFSTTSESLMTETLAVYLQQKNYKKAIQAYKILILKNPEKKWFLCRPNSGNRKN